MNTKLVESLITIIESLSKEERTLLEQKLFLNLSYPSPEEIAYLADSEGTFNFLNHEPDLYTLEDGEEIKW
ncbi:hypothetical protein [Planktothrix pseudagardhii]|uniref:Uncharacterized protein n=1 Tax=Planktothrix pseudagardhii TaxID=132604 RepID=A0A9W4CGU0_9CYAN|nr:hypothetical protein [Planktothrix pseudagardhii]CAD5930044.1 hypothetical protein NO713_01225 [Planktothrix pseudagardhii]